MRQDGKVKHETLGNISHLPDHIIDLVRRALKGETLVNPESFFSCVRSSPHGHVAAVLGCLKQLGLHSLIAGPASRPRDLVLAMIVARVIDARSKLATARALTPESAVSTLGTALRLGTVDENELYQAMDWLLTRQQGIEQRLAKRHLSDNTLVLYDLTSSYFEGHCCPLAQRGHSRDGKRGTLQIVFGLLCTAAGCPIAVEVFEGSTGDPKTVAAQVDKIRHRFGLQRVVLVGDRGMLTGARIREDLKGIDGMRWITTLRAPTIRKLIKAGQVAQSMFDERDLAEISSPEFPGERLIVCRNPVLADQRRRKRRQLLAATEDKLAPIVTATERAKEPLRGAAEIGVRVGKVINQHKVGKHFSTAISDDSFSFRRDQEKIATEAELDGLYIVRSNVEPEVFDAEQTVRAYQDLAKVELTTHAILWHISCPGGYAMARTQAVLPGGARLSDYLSVGVIARIFPLPAVRAALDECSRRSQRQRSLPAEVMVYYVIALGLFRSVSAREVLRCLVDGLRWMASSMPVRMSGKSGAHAAGQRAVPGAVPRPRGSGRRATDARGVVSMPAAGGIRWFDAGRTG